MKLNRNDILHVESCALLCIVLALLLPWWWAAAGALAAGIGKELWDREHGGVPSWSDVLWDIAGAAAGILVVILHAP